MDCYLLVDFGSTFTKLTLVSKTEEEIVAQSKSPTTINTSVIEGFSEAFLELKKQVKINFKITKTICCSSAAGGLKIVAIGITPSYTLEAAKRVAMGAGGRVIGSFSYTLTDENIDEIKRLNPDIILLTGGTEGGNKSYIITNAKKIAQYYLQIPVLVAGNSFAQDTIKKVFDKKIKAYYTENIMPDTDKINPYKANELIREIFMRRITTAKGMDEVSEKIGRVIMPTPTAVLKATNLLAKGTATIKGLGEMIVVDVGGATTDVHSISEPIKDRTHLQDGLEETVEKRTVEGDLGMRYSIEGVMNASEDLALKENTIKIYEDIKSNPFFLSKDDTGALFDEIIAKECVKLAITRHSGKVVEKYLNGNYVKYQEGKDLRNINYIIGTGGVIINSNKHEEIIGSIKDIKSEKLIPKNFQIKVDSKYILSAMGLLSTIDEELALKLMLKNIV